MFDSQFITLIILLLMLYGIYRTFMKSESKSTRILAHVSGYAFAVLTCMLALHLRPLIMDSSVVTSESMTPTLQVGDRVFTDRMSYKRREPQHGEIVSFTYPSRTAGAPDDILVKRVIGLPGDVVEVRDGVVIRNLERLDEPYIREPMAYELPVTKVPKEKLFVLGDNRNESDDSHVWGFLDRRRLIGRVTLRFWPISRMGSPG